MTRGTLAGRMTALAVCAAIVTGLLAGLLAVGLIRNADVGSARADLARVADTAAHTSDSPAARARTARNLRALGVRYGYISPRRATRLAAVLTPAQLDRVRSGGTVSTSGQLRGVAVYVEARPAAAGTGIVVAERHRDVAAAAWRAIRRTLLAIGIGVLVAALIAAAVARRLSRPLRRTADAAHALAAGERGVHLRADGPAEVAEVAAAVNALSAALGHSEARQREFLLSVSHDLRTPLTAITGYAESLATGVVPPERTASVGVVVQAEAARLTRLVTDLLDLARLDAHDFRVEPADVDLVVLATAAAEVWGTRCAAAGVAFRTELPADPAIVRTDPARVRQLIDGLLENALRVTPTGRPMVLAVRLEDAAVVEVRDGGPGLRPEDLAVAFDRGELYRRYQGVRQVGTGLGLAIVAGLAARLGATVHAGHAPEGGAAFCLRLPRH